MKQKETGTFPDHPRTVGWFGTTAVAMGGINQSLFLLAALFIGQEQISGQGSAAVPLLAVGLLLSWMAVPGWTELVLMFPRRVGGIAATCAEAFKPYSPVLANLTGVCYWWGWVPTCGLTALLAASALQQWYLPSLSIPWLATAIVLLFTAVNLCGVRWVMRLAMPIATASAVLAFASAFIPMASGSVNWQQALTFELTVPFEGWFGALTSIMAGLYLIGFAAPAFEQAACHVGETVKPEKNVLRAMFASAGLAALYFMVLPVVWLGVLGPEPLGKELALQLGPTYAPLLGAGAKAAAIWFMIFNMLHGTLAPLAGASRTLSQLSEDGLLPRKLALRNRFDAPWVATLLTAGMSIIFLHMGDPLWLIAAANLTYLIGIAMPSVAVWLLRRDMPDALRPYRAPRGTIALGLWAAAGWGLTVLLGFQQFGIRTVLIGIAFAYCGVLLYAWRVYFDRRAQGLAGVKRTLHIKLTGAMLLVLFLDGLGYLIAVDNVPRTNPALIAMLEDIFVGVALLTLGVGLVLPGMIAHSAERVSEAAQRLVDGTLADFERAMGALARGDLDAAKVLVAITPVRVYTRDEMSDMADNFNRLQQRIHHAAVGLDGAREGLMLARNALLTANQELTEALQQADGASRAKTEFLLSMSHELRTPLNAVLGFAQLLAGDDSLSADQRENALEITKAGRQLVGLMSDLLDLSRIEAGKVELKVQPLVVDALLSETIKMVQESAHASQLTLVNAGGDGAGVVVQADPLRCRQVVLNLLTNAIKYNRSGGSVTVACTLQGDCVRLSVQDTGAGISPELQARLFTPFDRLGREAGGIQGSGIGLVITKRLAEAMGGRVGFVSTEGVGSTFWVEFTVS